MEEGKGNQSDEDDNGVEEDDEEEDVLGFYNALFWLAAITVLIAFLSEAISETIQNAANDAGISGIFIAAILLPIVGNAAEHAGLNSFSFFRFIGFIVCRRSGNVCMERKS